MPTTPPNTLAPVPEVGDAGTGYASNLSGFDLAVDAILPISPRSRGAAGTGGNDTVGLQAAFNDAVAAEAAAGGTALVRVPKGIHLSGELIVPVDGEGIVVVEGDGPGLSAIRLRPGANSPLISTEGYAGLVGTDSTAGMPGLVLRNISLMGAKDGQTSPADLVRLYGRRFVLDHVDIGDSSGRGLVTEWSTDPSAPDIRGMEAVLTDVHVYGCDDWGVYWNGPHDSRWHGGEVYLNGGGIRVGPKGGATQFHGAHTYGTTQGYGWQIEAPGVILLGCQGEGATIMQLIALANDLQVIGGRWYQPPGLFETGGGIALGDADHEVSGCYIATHLLNFWSGAIDYSGDVGGNRFASIVYQTDGAEEIGSHHPETYGFVQMGGRVGQQSWFSEKGRWHAPLGIDADGNLTVQSDDFNATLRAADGNQRARLQFENPDATPTWAWIVDENGAADGRLVAYWGGDDDHPEGVALRIYPSGYVQFPNHLSLAAANIFSGVVGPQGAYAKVMIGETDSGWVVPLCAAP